MKISAQQADAWASPVKMDELRARFTETNTPCIQRWLAPDLRGDTNLAGAFFNGTHVLVVANGVALLLPKESKLPF